MAEIIKQIKTAAGEHLIEAAFLTNGSGQKTYSDIHDEIEDVRSIAQGAIETYVIPSTVSSETSGYDKVVSTTSAQTSTTKAILDTLTNTTSTYKVGDVILMGATSDGTKHFDRWVSKISGDTIYLDVLETQVAKHHHTINIESSNSKAITGVSTSSQTGTLTIVSTAVNVLTSAAGTFLTSVDYGDDGSYDLDINVGTSADGKGHTHTVDAHSHSFTPSSLVSQTASAYTSLTSKSYTLHTHGASVSVAGKTNNSTAINVVTGVSEKDKFIINLKDSADQTTGSNTGGLTAKANTEALSTSAQLSTDTIGSVVNTVSAGEHTHTVSTTTTENVVKSATLAASVVTSVSYDFKKPTVASNVVTSVTTVSKTAVTSATLTGSKTFMSSLDVTVSGGILSFGWTTASVDISAPTTVMSTINTITSTSQSQGSLTISAPRSAQSITSGTVSATGTAESAGSHSHGFSHTHTIPSHTHSIDSHTHTYVKTVASQTAEAIKTLTSQSYTPHTHDDSVMVAPAASTDASATNIVTGGSQTKVVQTLKSSSFSTGNSSPDTGTTYLKITGDITFPAISGTSGSVSTSSKDINPAATGTETALKSITFTSSNFITSVTSGTINTSVNKGGSPS